MRQMLGVVRAVSVLSLLGRLLLGSTALASERTITLAVESMYCAACPYIVKESLSGVPGVIHVLVSFEGKTATVTYDDQKTTPAALIEATSQAGFPAKTQQ